jgi:hypothetical protein
MRENVIIEDVRAKQKTGVIPMISYEDEVGSAQRTGPQ